MQNKENEVHRDKLPKACMDNMIIKERKEKFEVDKGVEISHQTVYSVTIYSRTYKSLFQQKQQNIN